MSFIKKNEEKSSIWDWIILAALLIGGLSLWWYLTSQKTSTNAGFEEADSLFRAGDYTGAKKLYDKLKMSDYLEPAHDSILFERLDSLETLFEQRSR